MKKSVILLSLVLICSCAPQQVVKEEEPAPSIPPAAPVARAPSAPVARAPAPARPEIPTQTLGRPILPHKEPTTPLFGTLLSEVNTSSSSFNPTQGQDVAIYFHLSKAATVTATVYDPDHGLIKVLAAEESMEAGEQVLVWDGKDLDGRIIPDEAYFLTITAEIGQDTKEIYDPTTFSGGEAHDITTADIDPVSHTINYRMPEMGRIMIRIGIQGGPLMNQLVDWKPRVKGAITEYWNGKDNDNLVDLYDHPKFKMIISYFSLPENSVIAFGNKDVGYRDYKKSLAAGRPVKPKRATSVERVSHHYGLPRTVDYSPDLQLSFSNMEGEDEDGVPTLRRKTLVRVELDEEDKLIFQNQQFEICFFLNHEFYAEDEAGYTPFNWVWDLTNVAEGEHLFTVNLSGFKDQIGVLSRKVKVVR